jgi:SP family general alpha glucoside:H+ symporter-like MFS transporter
VLLCPLTHSISYDTILIGNFFAYPEFRRKFGQDYGGDVGWEVSAAWQTGLNMASTVGGIFGMLGLAVSLNGLRPCGCANIKLLKADL